MLRQLFMLFYLGSFGLFLFLMHVFERPYPDSISGIDLLLLCLATFRVTELFVYDRITRFIRDPFVKREKIIKEDGTEEEKVKPAGHGFKRMMGELMICPWCIGIWISTTLTFFFIFAPGVARVFLIACSAAAGGILFQLFSKLLDQMTDKE